MVVMVCSFIPIEHACVTNQVIRIKQMTEIIEKENVLFSIYLFCSVTLFQPTEDLIFPSLKCYVFVFLCQKRK